MLLLDDQPFIADSPDEEKLYSCTNILDMLSTIRDSSSLRSVTIKFAFEAEEEVPLQILEEGMDWERMLSVLGSFKNLQRVMIVFIDGADTLEECRPLLLEKLHDFNERGLLEIRVLNEEILLVGARI